MNSLDRGQTVIEKRKTACFSGFRPEKLSFILLNGQEAYLKLEGRIKEELTKTVQDGYDTFLCGMAKGFDLVCGNILLSLKEKCSDFAEVKLIAVPPHHGHGFDGPWGIIHSLVMGKVDEIIYPTDKQNSHVCRLFVFVFGFYQQNRPPQFTAL
jgi:hypothetical protein